jgi:hypothetical protein
MKREEKCYLICVSSGRGTYVADSRVIVKATSLKKAIKKYKEEFPYWENEKLYLWDKKAANINEDWVKKETII